MSVKDIIGIHTDSITFPWYVEYDETIFKEEVIRPDAIIKKDKGQSVNMCNNILAGKTIYNSMAGSGKTTMLIDMINHNSDKLNLVIVPNKNVKY